MSDRFYLRLVTTWAIWLALSASTVRAADCVPFVPANVDTSYALEGTETRVATDKETGAQTTSSNPVSYTSAVPSVGAYAGSIGLDFARAITVCDGRFASGSASSSEEVGYGNNLSWVYDHEVGADGTGLIHFRRLGRSISVPQSGCGTGFTSYTASGDLEHTYDIKSGQLTINEVEIGDWTCEDDQFSYSYHQEARHSEDRTVAILPVVLYPRVGLGRPRVLQVAAGQAIGTFWVEPSVFSGSEATASDVPREWNSFAMCAKAAEPPTQTVKTTVTVHVERIPGFGDHSPTRHNHDRMPIGRYEFDGTGAGFAQPSPGAGRPLDLTYTVPALPVSDAVSRHRLLLPELSQELGIRYHLACGSGDAATDTALSFNVRIAPKATVLGASRALRRFPDTLVTSDLPRSGRLRFERISSERLPSYGAPYSTTNSHEDSNGYGKPEFLPLVRALLQSYATCVIAEEDRTPVSQSSKLFLWSEATSLPNGGLYDWKLTLKAPHANHRFGTDIDIGRSTTELAWEVKCLVKATAGTQWSKVVRSEKPARRDDGTWYWPDGVDHLHAFAIQLQDDIPAGVLRAYRMDPP